MKSFFFFFLLIRTTRRREEPAPRPPPALQNARFCVTTFAWLTTEKRWRRDTGELRVWEERRERREEEEEKKKKNTRTNTQEAGRERKKHARSGQRTWTSERGKCFIKKKKKNGLLFFSARSPVGLQTFRVACCSLLGAAGVQTLSSNSIF